MKEIKIVSCLLICLICAGLALSLSLYGIDRSEAKAERYAGETCEIYATVTECRGRGGQMSTFHLSVTSVNGQNVRYNALLTCYYIADLKPGHEIRLTAEAISLSETAGDVYEEYALISDGIFGGFVSANENDYTILRETPSSLPGRIARFRATLSEEMAFSFGKDAHGLPSALILGDRSYLTSELKRDFSRTGVSHLLAISGLHMTLLFGLLAGLLKLLRLPPRARAVILGIGASAYLIYLGFPPSATRAVIMLGMTYLATVCFTGADPITSLGVAGMGILLFSPTTVADIGFWMSFSTALGLLTVLPFLSPSLDKKEESKLTRLGRRGIIKLLNGLGAGVVSVTFSLWIVAISLGEMSWISAPLTLLLVPLVGILLLLIPLSLPFLHTPLAVIPITAVQAISDLILDITHACAQPSWVTVSLRHPAIPWVAAVTLISTLVLLGISFKRKSVVLIPMISGWVTLGLILCIQSSLSQHEVKISYLTPSTAAEMLVMTRGHEAVICELSNGSQRSFITATKEASVQGATEISVFILTDYHARTSGALYDLLRRETVRSLWMPKPTSAEEYYLMLSCLETAELAGTPVVIYAYGETLTLFENAELQVDRTMLERSVQPVLLITLQTPTDLLTVCGSSVFESDLAASAQAAVLQSDTVIFSNHGPLLKKAISCKLASGLSEVYFASETVAAHLAPLHYPDEQVRMTVGQGRFRMALDEP